MTSPEPMYEHPGTAPDTLSDDYPDFPDKCDICGTLTDERRRVKMHVPTPVGNPDGLADEHALYVCEDCEARLKGDEYRFGQPDPKNVEFQTNKLKGDVGEAIVAALLSAFEYEVYPFGQENQIRPAMNRMRGSFTDAADKIRSTPDFVVSHARTRKTLLLEVKTTSLRGSTFWMSNSDMVKYKKRWSEAVLVVVSLPDMNLFTRPIADLSTTPYQAKNLGGEDGRTFDLVSHFDPFAETFMLTDRAYTSVLDSLRTAWNRFTR